MDHFLLIKCRQCAGRKIIKSYLAIIIKARSVLKSLQGVYPIIKIATGVFNDQTPFDLLSELPFAKALS